MQYVRDARSVEHPLKKATGNEWSKPKKDCVGKVTGAGLHKPVKAYIMIPHILNNKYGAIGFSVCPAGFQSALVK
jgi:hypothetical protein